ncbi:WXG100 family type VII secretion target [Kineococcus sp. T13]|uniref:WXG100 family type VII secretion target n=1 Tax=Kineococcus vitellinus TaxID=2696565 RepID=UPI0014124516|nr:WXG100 family type VII secretion target [Kineococcus vitellinus]NAZ74685.1 WXG100 family type VII secretion target [Kineococcus vitellinus]
MADQIRVTFGALADAVNDISAGVAAAGNRLSDLKADIAPMVATWEGAAQNAYYAQQSKWDNAWSELTAALGDFQRATSNAASDYEAGERANTALWG